MELADTDFNALWQLLLQENISPSEKMNFDFHSDIETMWLKTADATDYDATAVVRETPGQATGNEVSMKQFVKIK